MTTVGASLLAYLRAPFWNYHPLSAVARRGLIVLIAVTLVLDSLFRATNGGATTVTSAVVTTIMTLSVGVVAWRPPIGALLLSATAIMAGVAGVTESLLAGAAIVGLVAFTCSARVTGVYLLAGASWLLTVLIRPDSSFQPLGAVVIGILSLLSLLIGLAIRQQTNRAKALIQQLEVSEREVAEQLRHERDLIADELHDIVAHEITIVALHAAVLDRTDDPQTRSQSQTAIREAAVQALTDIRRVLGMVRGEENLSPERVPSRDSIEGTIADITRELAQAGITVSAAVPAEIRMPSVSLVALTRVMRESATNVLKHATGAHNVHIDLAIERNWASLEFTDDSPPARTAGLPTSGYGIMRLRERFRVFGGTFDARRGPSGWTVRASLPLSDDAAASAPSIQT